MTLEAFHSLFEEGFHLLYRTKKWTQLYMQNLNSPLCEAGEGREKGNFKGCGPLKFRIDRRIILWHIIGFSIATKKAKILFKQRTDQLIEVPILRGKTKFIEATLQFNSQ